MKLKFTEDELQEREVSFSHNSLIGVSYVCCQDRGKRACSESNRRNNERIKFTQHGRPLGSSQAHQEICGAMSLCTGEAGSYCFLNILGNHLPICVGLH